MDEEKKNDDLEEAWARADTLKRLLWQLLDTCYADTPDDVIKAHLKDQSPIATSFGALAFRSGIAAVSVRIAAYLAGDVADLLEPLWT